MNFAVKLWQNHEHLRYFRNVSLPQNHELIYFAWLSFFLTTHVPDIFLVFVWVCGLSVKRSKQGFIYLICQENSFLQKGASIYGILNFFFLHKNFHLLHFCPFHRTLPIWQCFGNFLAHHKLDIKTFLRDNRDDIKSDSWGWQCPISGFRHSRYQIFF